MSQPIQIPIHFLNQIHHQAECDYPNETCGILVGPKTQKDKITEIYPCENIQDKYHALDPVSFPRPARTAYFIDPPKLLQIEKKNRERGEEIRVIYHSHVDAGAYFSEEDQRIALSEGRPTYPGVAYLVVSIRQGRIDSEALFSWDLSSKTFVQNQSR